jgi:hypothetical protein
VPTYDLRSATYTSDFLNFSSKEILDHQSKPLQKLDSDEQQLVDRFDKNGDYPFTLINGEYAGISSGYSPAIIQGMPFDTLFQQLASGITTPATQAIGKEADIIARYLCASTGGIPANVCQPLGVG